MTARPAGAPEIPLSDAWARWGIDPAWSRTVDVPSHDGDPHRWHVLDTATPDAAATVLCVHGNPTWAYAWATFLRRLGDRYRVVAVDQLGMGFSARPGPRRYAERVRDLDDVIGALGIDPAVPFVLAAHDWGGAIAMGWAVDHPDRLAGMILCNTGIAVPEGRSAPGIIRLAASAPLRDLVCRRTKAFVEGTVRLSGRRISAADREAFRAPYPDAASRAAIADFVGDIPLRPGHPSEAALADVADRLGAVRAPVLLAWGAKDPVFDDDFAADLAARLPNTALHRFPRANHLVMAEADVAGAADLWLADVVPAFSGETSARGVVSPLTGGGRADGSGESWAGGVVSPLTAGVERRRGDTTTAFVDLATGSELTWADFAEAMEAVASELARRGLRPGDRVAMLTPPGTGMVAAIFGVLRAGGVAVVADRGLGVRGLGAAVRGARPAWVIGPRRALAAAMAMRWAPQAAKLDVTELLSAEPGELPEPPGPDDPAAILFTSGATGPAKGVRYLHRQLAAQRDAIAATYGITDADRLVAAFAPFSLYGPALGIPTALPDCDVTTPGELTASALDDACTRIGATLAFASPAALGNVVATRDGLTGGDGLRALRVVMSAGAPVPAETLHAVAQLAPEARLHTPYGMTEALPVADIDLAAIDEAQRDDPAGGVCVGTPVDGAEVRIVPLGFDPSSVPDRVTDGVTGEILVSAPWMSEGYAGLWLTERQARPPGGDRRWHRSGDVGHLDGSGRLWVEGRSVHVIETVRGPVTPVPIERAVERAVPAPRAAAVGVGPGGCQQGVVVVEGGDDGLAPDDLTAAVRAAVDVPIAAVLTAGRLPVDIRHNSKIDRAAVGSWAGAVLAGRRVRRLR